VAIYCFVPFHKATFYGAPSQAIVKVGCDVGKKRLQNTAPEDTVQINEAQRKGGF
jgi:hypothetical protein